MSTYNIREKFSYTLATSSIEYIRNYNFNSATITDLPLYMSNLDTEIPITVNITTTVPWMSVVDRVTGKSVKYPDGNVVLAPTSSSIVLVKIDLPPEIENTTSSSLYPDIRLDIKSGSFPIIPPSTATAGGTTKNSIAVPQSVYTINAGDRVPVDITVYDINGNPDLDVFRVVWKSNDMSIVQVEEPENTQVDYNPYTPRTIRGISAGETTVTIIAGPEREASITFIVREAVTGQGGGNSGGGPDIDRERFA